MDIKTWVSISFGLLGGLGLFLYGMKLMSDGLQKTAGDKLKYILEKLTSNRFVGMGVGAVVTMLVQSSSATTVMIVGFVNAGLMSLPQALSVVLGANIGTTITAQILAFRIYVIALPAIAVGAVFVLFVKKTAFQYIGEIVLGVGMLFFGMTLMSEAVIPLHSSEEIREIFISFSKYPILAVLVGTITTVIVQSSAATIAITMSLALGGLVDFPGAVALVLGDNIGTTITANLAAIGGNRAAKQAAFGHFLFNFLGVCYMLVLMKPFMAIVDFLTPGDPTLLVDGVYPYVGRHIANVHTLFNVINAAVFVPLLPFLAFLCQKIIKTDMKQHYQYTHLADALANTPETAVAQVKQEAGRMSALTMTMLKTAETAIQQNDKKKMATVSDDEKALDGYQREIQQFLEIVQRKPLSERAVHSIENLRVVIHSLEEIGDQTRKIMKITTKMLDKKQNLSEAATKELDEMFDIVIFFAGNTFNAFSRGRRQNEQELEMEDQIDKMRKQFRKNHIKRLNKGICDIEIGFSFVDILNALEKIGDHIFTVAQLNLTKN